MQDIPLFSLNRFLSYSVFQLCTLVLVGFAPLCTHAVDDPWIGITPGSDTNPFVHLADFGIQRVRLGAGAWSGGGDLQQQDDTINSYFERGYTIHAVINYRGNGIDLAGTNIGQLQSLDVNSTVFETWYNNYKAACLEVMQRYQGKIYSYICGNEPDLSDPFTGLPGRPDIAVLMTKAMYEAANQVDPEIVVQSSPVSHPNAGYLKDMILDYALAAYCDVIGVHGYGSQFREEVMRMPWQWLDEVGVKMPVGISECGVPLNVWWNEPEITDDEWRERWHALSYVQAKSFGYSYMLLFINSGTDSWTDNWAYRDRNNNFQPIQPNYSQVKSLLKRRAFANGGFEEENDPLKEWVAIIPFDQPIPPNDIIFVDGDSANAASGDGYLKLGSDGRIQRRVKRVVPNLTVGATYEITAKASMHSGGGVVILAARGFDPLDGDAEIKDERVDLPQGVWTDMKVTFVAKNPWVVIDLRADYGNDTRFDDVTITQISGALSQAVWKDVEGYGLSAIPLDEQSDCEGLLSQFEAPTNMGENYGQTLDGFIIPERTGNYTFWIAGDDQVELWLSPDQAPANAVKVAYHYSWTNPREWDRFGSQKSTPISMIAGRKYYIEALMKQAVGGDNLAVAWKYEDTTTPENGSSAYIIPGAALVPWDSASTPAVTLGSIKRSVWKNIPGNAVADIPLGQEPDMTNFIPSFETSSNFLENYGQRLEGFIHPKETGAYTFWIAGDDHVQLILSYDENPENAGQIAYHQGSTAPREWRKFGSQQSAAISLVAGRRYYVRALMKEGIGDDNLAVAWKLNDSNPPANGDGQHIIPGSVLSPWTGLNTPRSQYVDGRGSVTRWVWNNVGGVSVSDIPVEAPADSISTLASFEAPANAGDQYGQSIAGFLHPDVSGAYTFWIAGDDNVELRLSADSNPANSQRIAHHNGWTNQYQWGLFSSQESEPINLVAGEKYYIEALMKEEVGGDNLAVSWKLNDTRTPSNGSREFIIPGSALSPIEQ